MCVFTIVLLVLFVNKNNNNSYGLIKHILLHRNIIFLHIFFLSLSMLTLISTASTFSILSVINEVIEFIFLSSFSYTYKYLLNIVNIKKTFAIFYLVLPTFRVRDIICKLLCTLLQYYD
jgi:hypothetical protein